MLWLIWPNNITETGIDGKNSPPKTYDCRCQQNEIYARQKNLRDTWIFPEKIPEGFDFGTRAVQGVEEKAGQNKESGKRTVIYDGDILDYISKKFGEHYQEAVLIMNCESSGNQYAINLEEEAKKRWIETEGKSGTPYSSCGLFQINSELCSQNNSILYNPIVNIDAAWNIFSKYGWSRWTICKNQMKL